MSHLDQLPDTYPSPGCGIIGNDVFATQAFESDKPNCARCPKQAGPGECAILGQVTEAALKQCALAGYWDCFKPQRRDDGPYRRSKPTGMWAEALEKR